MSVFYDKNIDIYTISVWSFDSMQLNSVKIAV